MLERILSSSKKHCKIEARYIMKRFLINSILFLGTMTKDIAMIIAKELVYFILCVFPVPLVTFLSVPFVVKVLLCFIF